MHPVTVSLARGLGLAVALKVRRSVPRAAASLPGRARIARLALGLTLALVAAAALTGGYLWVALGELTWLDLPTIGRLTVLTFHAWVGLLLVPLVLVHLLPRRWRLLRPGPGAVERAGGNISKAAQETGMHRVQLHSLLRRKRTSLGNEEALE